MKLIRHQGRDRPHRGEVRLPSLVVAFGSIYNCIYLRVQRKVPGREQLLQQLLHLASNPLAGIPQLPTTLTSLKGYQLQTIKLLSVTDAVPRG